jgi:hypothetical protein
LVLVLHFQGQMTCERILALLNGAGVVISKRQVVRLLAAKLETFRAEDEEVLTAGLSGSRFVTVDDTGARHQGKSGFTTHIGSDRFAVFRTGPSKSRLAFLRNLLGGAARYVINEAALVYMRDNNLPQAALDKLANCAMRVFASDQDWMRRLSELSLTELTITPDPVRVASEGALWGALQEEGRLGDLVIVSDGAGQFRVGVHAQCWVHAERLVHKLIPANQIQRKAVEVARRMIWWFYGKLKDYKLAPSPERAEILRAQFKRIFDRAKTGYAALDSLLRRPLRLEDRLMRVPHLLVDHRRAGSASVADSQGANGLSFLQLRWPASNRNRWPDCVGIRSFSSIASTRRPPMSSEPRFGLALYRTGSRLERVYPSETPRHASHGC